MEINEPYNCPLCDKHVTTAAGMGEKVVQTFQASSVTGLKLLIVCADCASIEARHPIGRIDL